MNLNKVLIAGNLTRDPETREVGSTSVTSLSIAVNKRWTDAKTGEKKEKTAFIDCKAWGKTGTTIAQYVHKGDPIYVEGEWDTETWEDKNGGGKRSKSLVNVREFQFVGGRSSGGTGGVGDGAARTPGRGGGVGAGRSVAERVNHQKVTEAHTVTEDDIPF